MSRSYFIIPTMHGARSTSGCIFPCTILEYKTPSWFKQKEFESHNQIRAVPLGLRWGLVIPANSPSDHMGVVDPLVWHANINYYWKLEEWLDSLDSSMFIVSTRSAGLTRGSRGLSWYTRWRRCLVLHRNYLYKMTRHHHYYPRMSWIIRLLPPFSCLFFASGYLRPEYGVPEWELVHCSMHRQARSDRAHPLRSNFPRNGRNRRSHWSWPPTLLRLTTKCFCSPQWPCHPILPNPTPTSLKHYCPDMVIGYVTVVLRIHAQG